MGNTENPSLGHNTLCSVWHTQRISPLQCDGMSALLSQPEGGGRFGSMGGQTLGVVSWPSGPWVSQGRKKEGSLPLTRTCSRAESVGLWVKNKYTIHSIPKVAKIYNLKYTAIWKIWWHTIKTYRSTSKIIAAIEIWKNTFLFVQHLRW